MHASADAIGYEYEVKEDGPRRSPEVLTWNVPRMKKEQVVGYN